MKLARWAVIAGLLAAFLVADIIQPLPGFSKCLMPLLLACLLPLVRLMKGPTAADRAAALKVLGLLIAGICGLLAAVLKQDLYIDIALAWSFQAFVGTLAIAKFIEGRKLDD
jgi:multicomponent Na+:H+ antiporter subunit F